MTSDAYTRSQGASRADSSPPGFGSTEVHEELGLDDDPRGRHATTRGQGFGRVVLWTILGTLIPGSGFIAAGNTALGITIILLIVLGAVTIGGLVLLGNPVALAASFAGTLAANLLLAAVVMVVIALLWLGLVIGTHASLRQFADLTRGQKLLSAVLVTAMTLMGGAPAVQGAVDLWDAKATSEAVTQGVDSGSGGGIGSKTVVAPDPWVNQRRVNLLLIGSDAAPDRPGVRTDSVMVASIDTKTGNTVLFGLPRNLEHVPFPPKSAMARDFPNGFYCPGAGGADACLLNALWTFGTDHKDSYYKGVKNPGLKALTDGVETTLGLTMNNYVMLNMKGFQEFVDAIGGVWITSRQRLPMGGSVENHAATFDWIKPGRQKMDGFHAFWYGRSRWTTTDFDRMVRQRCVIAAVVQQTSVQAVTLNLPKILHAVRASLLTNIQADQYSAWLTLAQRIKSGHLTSLPFTDQVISTGSPNYTFIRSKVDSSIASSEAAPKTTPSASDSGSSATTAPSTSATASKKKSTSTATSTAPLNPTKAQDVSQAC